MLISCSICKELFDANSEVWGIKCGHIYHESCLKKWQERNESCPQCRTKIREKPLRIYLDAEDDPESGDELDVNALKEKIASVQERLAETKRKNKQLEEDYARVNGEVADYNEKVLSAEGTIRGLQQRVKELVVETKKLEPLLSANESLKVKIQRFTNLETLLKGSEDEVSCMIRKTPVTALAVHQLCVYVQILKSQLRTTEEKYKRENERLLLNYNIAKKKLSDIQNELHDKKIQTSPKRHCQFHKTESEIVKNDILKRPCHNMSPTRSENKPGYSSGDEEFEPPVKKKTHGLVQRKVINNLEKTVKKVMPDDPDEVLIFPGPSKSSLSVRDLDNKSIFRKMVRPEKDPIAKNSRTDVTYDAWGRSARNILAVSSPDEERGGFKSLNKSLNKKKKLR